MNWRDAKLFTLGYSLHEPEAFLRLLRLHGINAVADVRSSPYSRHRPDFNRERLAEWLDASGIRYVFLGKELGARREEPECYVNGQVQFARVGQLPLFQQGVTRLLTGLENFCIALLCAEKDPLDCHRFLLVCRHLRESLQPRHILADGEILTQQEAELALLQRCGLPPGDLFRSREELVELAYEELGRRIAYELPDEKA